MTRYMLLAVVLAGCGKTTLEDEACGYFRNGPVSAVTAVSWGDGAPSPPIVRNDHKRYDITVPAGRYSYSGIVGLEVDESGDYAFFLSPDREDLPVGFTVRDVNGQDVRFTESASPVDECAEVDTRYIAPLQAGRNSILFNWGPGMVSLVVEKHTR